MHIRKAVREDLSRIAEIFIFNNRMNYFPIFQDEGFSFGEMQVIPLADHYFGKEDILSNTYVYDDGIVRGFLQMDGSEICKLYVDTFFQGGGVGGQLVEFAVREFQADRLWALEKNVRAVSFYKRHGFCLTGERKQEEDTAEYLVRLERRTVC